MFFWAVLVVWGWLVGRTCSTAQLAAADSCMVMNRAAGCFSCLLSACLLPAVSVGERATAMYFMLSRSP